MAKINEFSKSKMFSDLRSKAELLLKDRPTDPLPPLLMEFDSLFHDLEVQKVELEMQNNELLQAHVEIEKSSSRYFDLYDFAPIGYFTTDKKKSSIIEANLAFAEMLGFERAKITGKAFTTFISRDSQDDFYLHKQRVFETGNKNTCELKLSNKDGLPLYVHLESTAIKDDRGELSQIRSAMIDITERKQSEAIIKREKIIRDILIDGLPCIAMVLKKQTREIVSCNKTAKQYGAVVGKKCFESICKKDNPCPFCKAPELWSKGENQFAEAEYIGKYWEGRWDILSDELFIHYLFDVTDRNNTEKQLRQSQKMDSLGTLAGGIAHEFNNILAGITGYTEIVLGDVPEGNPVRESLDMTLKLCSRARDTVKQILTFTRKGEKEKKPIQPHILIKESLKVLRASIPTTIEFKLNIDEKSGTIIGDPTQIYQVGMNLCTNAAQAMDATGGEIEVEMVPVFLDAQDVKKYPDLIKGDYIRLTIRDNGTGIKPENIEKVFDPFFTTKEVGMGTGIGLSVVAGIIKDHGGAIGVSSKPGEGSTFTVFLPKTEEKIEEQKSTDSLPLGTENILIVDDEDFNVFLLKANLDRLGYTVTATTSSLEALELFKKDPQRYDLIISDLTMPNLTGDLLASEIIAIRPDMPVIIATGYSNAADNAELNQNSIKAFIYKPYKLQDLARTVRIILNQK